MIVACVEIEERYCKTLHANYQPSGWYGHRADVHCTSVEDFEPAQYVEAGIECIIGGPPCQTFSAAGRRSGGVIGTADRRGRLFERYAEIIEEIKPRVFVFENVYGLPGANGGGPWREILREFASLGYNLNYEVIDAADYGVPQHRERLVLVGVKDGAFTFPVPTHGPDSGLGRPLVSVRDVIDSLQDPDEPFYETLGGRYGHLLPLVPEGLNYSFFTSEMGHPEPQFAWRSKFHDLLYKVDPESPCRTIKASPGKFTGPFHWKNRHFTIPELKRLQSFPDEYTLVGSNAVALEQIGNSVPPRMAYVVATSISEQVLRPKSTIEFPLRASDFKSTFRQRQRERSKAFKEIAKAAIERQYNTPKALPETITTEETTTEFKLAEGHFKIEYSDSLIRSRNQDQNVYEIQTTKERNGILLNFKKVSCKSDTMKAEVSITGLKRYLGDIDYLLATAQIDSVSDVFHVWAAIERALVSRSRFFTLIDIYGHYANRGDEVTIKTNFNFDSDFPAGRLINYFSQSANSGGFVTKDYLARNLKMTSKELKLAIQRLRDERFDLRTNDTHPIIKPDLAICTYPFPLLSARALVVSRAELVQTSIAGIGECLDYGKFKAS